ncbi:MAG: type I DNA topoisomerase [Patescibacteria group bacterium]
MKLVIVESPTKAKTISKFLGKGYEVQSSYGHVRDLPKSKLGIDVENDFTPQYLIPKKALPNVAELRKFADKAKEIVLATDEDREGEAIAWHLISALELEKRKVKPDIKRIVFHEITESAIREAITHPREIDLHLVDAQQARRILDRLVGYELSPFLWRKVRYGLSAGRVQSVTVRLIVEREREIQKFIREEYWSLEALCNKKGDKQTFRARLYAVDGKSLGKMDLVSEKESSLLAKEIKERSYSVERVTVKELSRNPSAPFTTSTLQQEAARKLGFSAKQTMVLAQRLYENGHITYMRTDSVNLAKSALLQAKEVVHELFGAPYALEVPRQFTNRSKGAQEAHEAVRPTDLSKKTGKEIGAKERGIERLYDLIWKRTIASQMQNALLEQTATDIKSDDGHITLRANGQVVKFDGFIRAYTEGKDEEGAEDEDDETLPQLKEGDSIEVDSANPLQHFTEPPPRYTDATLVKALETEGIGRPSTYAPTLSTIQERGYVEKIEKRYSPTEIGFVVNDLLVENFPEIVDIKFTSHVEEELDEVAEGKIEWRKVCREFYGPFKENLKKKEIEVEKHIEISETPCPHCQKIMMIKFGRMGKFLACPDPESKVTLPMPEEAAKIKELEEKTRDERCSLCGGPMNVKRGRFGFFLGCSKYPECKGISRIWNRIGFKCPHCTLGDVVEKKSRGRGKPFFACTRWPECTFITNKKPESEEELAQALVAWKEKQAEPKESQKKPRLRKKK